MSSTTAPTTSQTVPPSSTSASTTSSPPDPAQTQEARTAFLASLSSTGTSALQPLEQRARDIHTNSAPISAQEASVQNQTSSLAKENQSYEKMLGDAGGQLKEIGDVQNWAEMLERDLLVLEETMGIVEEEEDQRRENVGADSGGKKGKRGGSWS